MDGDRKEINVTITAFKDKHRFLSNFTPAKVEFDGVQYDTVEHAYQAAKTIDKGEREKIRAACAPGVAKRLGQKVTIRPDWEQIKVKVMYDLVSEKFSRYPVLKQFLLDTGSEEIIEGNHWNDTFWGVCNGVGENHLGKILMKVREELQ